MLALTCSAGRAAPGRAQSRAWPCLPRLERCGNSLKESRRNGVKTGFIVAPYGPFGIFIFHTSSVWFGLGKTTSIWYIFAALVGALCPTRQLPFLRAAKLAAAGRRRGGVAAWRRGGAWRVARGWRASSRPPCRASRASEASIRNQGASRAGQTQFSDSLPGNNIDFNFLCGILPRPGGTVPHLDDPERETANRA